MDKIKLPEDLVEALEVTDVRAIGDPTAMSGAITCRAKSNRGDIFIKVDSSGLLDLERQGMGTLNEIGWPNVLPIVESGANWIVYPYVRGKTVFSILQEEKGNEKLFDSLRSYYSEYARLFLKNLTAVSASKLAKQPWQVLFSERYDKTNPQSRINERYVNRIFTINEEKTPFKELKDYYWTINGRPYDQTLGQLIDLGYQTMLFSGRKSVPAAIAPVDDHCGNQVFADGKLLIIDQPYAGLAPISVALCKMMADTLMGYMFYTTDSAEARKTKIVVNRRCGTISIDYDDTIDLFRNQIIELIFDDVFVPIMKKIKEDYPDYVKNYFRSEIKAFYAACLWPVFNPNNLSDKTKVLLLARSIEFGCESPKNNKNFLDKKIDGLLSKL